MRNASRWALGLGAGAIVSPWLATISFVIALRMEAAMAGVALFAILTLALIGGTFVTSALARSGRGALLGGLAILSSALAIAACALIARASLHGSLFTESERKHELARETAHPIDEIPVEDERRLVVEGRRIAIDDHHLRAGVDRRGHEIRHRRDLERGAHRHE